MSATSGAEMIEAEETAESRTIKQWRPWLQGWLISVVLVVAIWFPLQIFQPFGLSKIDGTQKLDRASFCIPSGQICSDMRTVTLPHFSTRYNQVEPAFSRFELRVDLTINEQTPLQSFYLPKLSDTIRVTINGQRIAEMSGPNQRGWFYPRLYELPEGLLIDGTNRINLEVRGRGQEGTQLYPAYIGPTDILRPSFERRYGITRDMAQLGFFSVLVVSMLLLALSLSRPRDQQFLWLCLGGLTMGVMASYFAFDAFLISYRLSVIRFIFALQLFIFCMIKFYEHFLNIRVRWMSQSYAAYLCVSLLTHLFSPESHIMTVAVWLTVGNFVWTYLCLAMVWVHRHLLSPPTFWAFYLTYVGAAVTGAHDFQFFLPNTPISNIPILHFLPLFAAIGGLLLVGTQLLSAVKKSENFNRILQSRIEETTQELEQSYAMLAESQRRSAIEQERNRIMLDLHDGVGGQLVNMLAYMQNNQVQDDVLKDALDDALTDLGLMIDSLQTGDSVTTLIGMFRSRAEPLLSRHGLRFQWEIGDEPLMPRTGPSENLTLLRIIQEAVTNAVKHSGADIIRVHTDTRSVTISDNGHGFDLSNIETGKEGSGVGLISMKHRSGQIGADLEILSDNEGTTVRLIWPEGTNSF